MDAVLNPEKGEVGIRLGGRLFAMKADPTACNAIESQIGAAQWMWFRFAQKDWLPTLREMAVVVTECIRAGGRDRKDEMLSKVSVEKIASMIFAEGTVSLMDPFADILHAMVTGGSEKKKAADDSSTPSEQTDSPI
jgi:hypothetical protein